MSETAALNVFIVYRLIAISSVWSIVCRISVSFAVIIGSLQSVLDVTGVSMTTGQDDSPMSLKALRSDHFTIPACVSPSDLLFQVYVNVILLVRACARTHIHT